MTPQQYRTARLALEYSHEQMAELLHCNERTSKAYEYGERDVPILTARVVELVCIGGSNPRREIIQFITHGCF